jgi:hypothetical protein
MYIAIPYHRKEHILFCIKTILLGVFFQTFGIPMGTYCALLLGDLFL